MCTYLVLFQLFHSLNWSVYFISINSCYIGDNALTLYAADSELGHFIFKLVLRSTLKYYVALYAEGFVVKSSLTQI